MKVYRSFACPMIVMLMTIVSAPLAHGAIVHDVTGWDRHNGPAGITVNNANTNSPSLTGTGSIIAAGDNYALMAPINPVTLTNPGDFITFTTSVQFDGRTTGTGAQALNNNLRFGVFTFNGSGAFSGNSHDPIVFEDEDNDGIFARYGNGLSSTPHLTVFEKNTHPHNNPFLTAGITQIGTGNPDVGGDSIFGTNPGVIDYEITITRTGDGKLDIAGFISGGNYFSDFSILGHSSATYPENGPFTFNRVGVYFNNANAPTVNVIDAKVTTNVPEPQSLVLAGIMAIGGAAFRGARHRNS